MRVALCHLSLSFPHYLDVAVDHSFVVHVLNRQQAARRVKAGQRQTPVAQAPPPLNLQVHRQIGLVRQQHVQVGFRLEG